MQAAVCNVLGRAVKDEMKAAVDSVELYSMTPVRIRPLSTKEEHLHSTGYCTLVLV